MGTQVAQVLETRDQLERAAALYEEDGQLEQALKVQIKLERIAVFLKSARALSDDTIAYLRR